MADTSEFTTNDRYLIHEYHKRGSSDYYLTDIGDKTFVVPCRYVAKAKDGVEAIRLFKADLLDFQNEELKKYQAADKKPRIIKVSDEKFVVPFDTPKDFDAAALVNQIVEKAEVKYNTIINAHRMLREITSTNFSTAALNRYTKKLAQQNKSLLLDTDALKHLEIYHHLCKTIQEKKKKTPQAVVKMAKKLRAKILDFEFKSLKKYKPRYWKVALLAGMLSVSGYHLFHSRQEIDMAPPPTIFIPQDTVPLFTDFKGQTYTDSLGNLQQIRDLQPQIMTTLIAVEGFAENTFLDGRGNPTIGSGFTVTINEDGSTKKVKKGDVTTIEDDVIQNTRYIEREFSSVLGDNMGRQLTPEEIYACIGSGYCWGTDGFAKSKFFNSLKNNEPVEKQCQKLSGFRTPLGLIKREFVLAQLLSGNWKVDELLDMPIYYVKGKGYVHCGIYSLDFHDFVPCKKDKKGNYVKDKKGYDIPIICADKSDSDGFCQKFYQPSFKEILKKIHTNPMNRGMPYKTVRQLLHKDLLAKLNMKTQQETNIYTFQALNQFKLEK